MECLEYLKMFCLLDIFYFIAQWIFLVHQSGLQDGHLAFSTTKPCYSNMWNMWFHMRSSWNKQIPQILYITPDLPATHTMHNNAPPYHYWSWLLNSVMITRCTACLVQMTHHPWAPTIPLFCNDLVLYCISYTYYDNAKHVYNNRATNLIVTLLCK